MLRNIETLVAWQAAAAHAITFFRKAPRPPRIQLVEVADHSSEAFDDMWQHGQLVVEMLKEQANEYAENADGRLSDWIEANCAAPRPNQSRTRPCRVHSEAGLMALLKEGKLVRAAY